MSLSDEAQVPCTAGAQARDGRSAHSTAGMEPRLLVPEPGRLHLCTAPQGCCVNSGKSHCLADP